ncbi:uncharacterized transmembrane protein DDB_G0289901-like [Athalia rosae]|uniref:uncharacterized transmembrane protein DDB_G0289901-like n=1 Tax=Athalia rosae TaxID=37344 RepID=UPI0020331FAB|nr:uncharacterized transmembrane protein DDB_G0289901-like [Athalia rosae]
MAKCVWITLFLMPFIFGLCTGTPTGDRIIFNDEDERRWNTPPVLIPEPLVKSNAAGRPDGRFLPFSASFSLSAGASNAHSLSVGANEGGVSLSQSASHADTLGSFNSHGSGLSASQSSSFSSGLSGISASDANAFNLNHPIFGGTSQANSNSFSLGDATATSQGNSNNGQANSGAQSGVGGVSSGGTSTAGSGHSSAGSQASASEYHGRPTWSNFGPNTNWNHQGNSPNWRPSQGQSGNFGQNNRQPFGCGSSHRGNFRSPNHRRDCDNGAPVSGPGSGATNGGGWNREPSTQISAASASSGASSTGNGFSIGQSFSQSNSGANGPSSSTNHRVQTSGNAQGFSQGSAAAVGQSNGQTDASFGSGTLVGSSHGTGQSFGTAVSGNRGQYSKGQVDSQTLGEGTVQGTANAGSVSFVRFPGESVQNIPREFVRSRSTGKKKGRDPVDTIITEITDSVADLFDI